MPHPDPVTATFRLDHPLPQFARDPWLGLDGVWQLRLDPGGPWREILVPFSFESALSGIGAGAEVHERLRYRRTFRVPDDWRGRTLVRFGAVGWRGGAFWCPGGGGGGAGGARRARGRLRALLVRRGPARPGQRARARRRRLRPRRRLVRPGEGQAAR